MNNFRRPIALQWQVAFASRPKLFRALHWPDIDRPAEFRYFQCVGHEFTNAFSLELGCRVAARLRARPELLRIATENLDRWTARNADAPSLLRCYAEWREILRRPFEDICELLTADTEEARRLRQNSPFPGVLNAREVWELKQQYRHATAPA